MGSLNNLAQLAECPKIAPPYSTCIHLRSLKVLNLKYLLTQFLFWKVAFMWKNCCLVHSKIFFLYYPQVISKDSWHFCNIFPSQIAQVSHNSLQNNIAMEIAVLLVGMGMLSVTDRQPLLQPWARTDRLILMAATPPRPPRWTSSATLDTRQSSWTGWSPTETSLTDVVQVFK